MAASQVKIKNKFLRFRKSKKIQKNYSVISVICNLFLFLRYLGFSVL